MNLSQREKRLIVFAIIIGVLVGYYLYVYEPMAKEIIAIKEETTIQEQKLKEIMALTDIKDKRETRERDFQELYTNIKLSIPPGGNIPQFLVTIEELTKGLTQVQRNFVPQGIVDNQNYSVHSIEYTLTGISQTQILEFIKILEDMERLVAIKDLSYSIYDRDGKPEHQLGLRIEIYGLKDKFKQGNL